MNGMDVFFADPWWLVLIKAVFALVFLLVMTLFTIWFERRVVGVMQHRKGPTMNGPFGLLQSLADGMKLMFKEDFTPKNAEKVVFMIAPFVMAIPAVTAIGPTTPTARTTADAVRPARAARTASSASSTSTVSIAATDSSPSGVVVRAMR